MRIEVTNQNVDMGHQIILSNIPHLLLKDVLEAIGDALADIELGEAAAL